MPPVPEAFFTASFNREVEWKQCCANVMGFDDMLLFDEWENPADERTGVHDADPAFHTAISLLGDGFDDNDDDGKKKKSENGQGWEDDDDDKGEAKENDVMMDHWSENASRIHNDLVHMAEWIRNKQRQYVSLEMTDSEASIIQSTVTSFAATAASELETLRKIIPKSSSNISSHRNGVVQILLSNLQEQITGPFAILQKQRTRVAVQLWQNPLQCKLYQPKKKQQPSMMMMGQTVDDDDDDIIAPRDQRFLPRRQKTPGSNVIDFHSKYSVKSDTKNAPRPSFLNQLEKKQGNDGGKNNTSTMSKVLPKPLKKQPMPPSFNKGGTEQVHHLSVEESRRLLEEDLQQEVALLTVAAESDLDSVQQMEQRMVQITKLIGQFANLVTEQQENVLQIHDSAQETKDNIEKGQENLMDATERVKRSKHYMAWSVFGMSLILLFFHSLRW